MKPRENERHGKNPNPRSTRWSPAALEASLARIERNLELLADQSGVQLELAVDATPGVRNNLPSTYNEWVAARRREAEQ